LEIDEGEEFTDHAVEVVLPTPTVKVSYTQFNAMAKLFTVVLITPK